MHLFILLEREKNKFESIKELSFRPQVIPDNSVWVKLRELRKKLAVSQGGVSGTASTS